MVNKRSALIAATIAVASLATACSGSESASTTAPSTVPTATVELPPGCEPIDGVDLAEATSEQADSVGNARAAFEADGNALAAGAAGRIQAAAAAGSPIDGRDVDALDAHCSEKGALPALAGEYRPELVTACGQLLGSGELVDDPGLVEIRTAALNSIAALGGAVSAPLANTALGADESSSSGLATLRAACFELPGVVSIAPPTTTTAPPTTAPRATPPTTACQGASGCAYDNGIDFNELRNEIAADSTASSRPVSADDVDCDSQSTKWSPNRTPVGERISCLLPMDGYWAITLYDVTVLGNGKYRWEIADV